MFEYVTEFESQVAEFFGSPYAVATDCCTHAIELCLRYTNSNHLVIPSRTYVSIPMTFMKLGLKWAWCDEEWEDSYRIHNSNIRLRYYVALLAVVCLHTTISLRELDPSELARLIHI